MAHRPQPRKSEQANPVRAARTRELAQLGAEVTHRHPAGPATGTITRVSEASIWVTFQPSGMTLRFTQRLNGEYRQSGKGQYSPALVFQQELQEWQARIDGAEQ